MKDQTEYHISRMISVIEQYGLINFTIFVAMKRIPRHLFVPENIPIDTAYGDHPIPIGEMQTISQPYTVAFMLDLLELAQGLSVLEIGTGSGWNAALIKELVGDEGSVTSMEISESHARKAEKLIGQTGLDVNVVYGDGSKGYEKNGPYDRIISTCAAPKIMKSWVGQLRENGIIVAPVGLGGQEMVKCIKSGNRLVTESHGMFRFVPMQTWDD